MLSRRSRMRTGETRGGSCALQAQSWPMRLPFLDLAHAQCGLVHGQCDVGAAACTVRYYRLRMRTSDSELAHVERCRAGSELAQAPSGLGAGARPLQTAGWRMDSDVLERAHARYELGDGTCALRSRSGCMCYTLSETACAFQTRKRHMRSAVQELARAQCGLTDSACAVQTPRWRMRTDVSELAHAPCRLHAGACALRSHSWRMRIAVSEQAHALF